MIKTATFFLTLLFTFNAHAIDLSKVKPLTNHEEIRVGDDIQSSVKACKKQGLSHTACLCKQQTLIHKQSKLIKQALAQYPHWLTMQWFQFKHQDGKSYILNAIGLQRRTEMKLDCLHP